MFEILIWPFLAAVVLAGIHAYLGMHVIERGIIFVDLALAQTAALGALAGFLAGFEMHTTGSYFFSLGFTLCAALFLSFTRNAVKEIPREALIGVLYVFAAAAAVLILSKAPSEAEHIKYMLVGNILFVKPEEVIITAVLYTGIAGFHFVFRDKFMAITKECPGCEKKMNVMLWDFLFYATFGAVVTSSVATAGVLLVFSYLIVPAALSFMFFKGVKARLLFSWAAGVACSILGIALSVFTDLPTGASITAVFGLVFTVVFTVRALWYNNFQKSKKAV